MQFLYKHAKKIRFFLFFGMFIFFISFGLQRVSAYIGAELIAFIAKSNPQQVDKSTLIYLICALFITIFVSTSLLFTSHIFEAKTLPALYSSIYKDLFNRLHLQSANFFNKEMSGSIITKFNRVYGNVWDIYDCFYGVISLVASYGITMTIICFINIKLGLFYLFISGIFGYITAKNRTALINDNKEASKLESVAGGVLADGINNALVVKNFSNQKYEKLFCYSSLKKYLRYLKKADIKKAFVGYKSNSIFDFMSICFYFGVFFAWYKDGMSVTNVVFIISSISMLGGNIKQFGWTLLRFFKTYGRLKDSVETMYQEPTIKDAANAKKLKIKKADIVFDNVFYGYDEKGKLFNKFNLKINAKQKVGLVGHSGSGKSTLIKLLGRMYDIDGGKILIDGQDITKVSQYSLRKNIALIPQEPLLFNRSLKENIAYGNTKATEDDIIKASKMAFCHEFIINMPNGYDSRVGEKGVMLSGGERQRIAIARAILQNAPILILDEATSALDSQSEAYVQKALKNLMKSKTVIAIAHRLSTLKEMDKIVVMDGGEIIEEGSKEELLKHKGAFYKFYKMQA